MADFFFNALVGAAAAAAKDDAFTLDLLATAENLSWSYYAYWSFADGGYRVDYGDGTGLEKPIGSTGVGAQVTHTYASPGSYKVRFKGLGSGLYRLLLQSIGILVGCNFNWAALGNLTNGQQMFNGCPNLAGTLTSLPPDLTNGRQMFCDCNRLVAKINSLPSGLTGHCGSMFDKCYKAEIDLDTLVANAPAGGWPGVTNMSFFIRQGGSGNVPGTVTGSQSAFQAMFPNATWTQAFNGTNTTA